MRHTFVEAGGLSASIGEVKDVLLLLAVEHQLDVVAQFQVTRDAVLELGIAFLETLGPLALLVVSLTEFLAQHTQRLLDCALLEYSRRLHDREQRHGHDKNDSFHVHFSLGCFFSHIANHTTAMTITAITTHGMRSSRPMAVGDATRKEVHTTVMNTAGIKVMI